MENRGFTHVSMRSRSTLLHINREKKKKLWSAHHLVVVNSIPGPSISQQRCHGRPKSFFLSWCFCVPGESRLHNQRIVGASASFVVLLKDAFINQVTNVVQSCVGGAFANLGPLARGELAEETVELHVD